MRPCGISTGASTATMKSRPTLRPNSSRASASFPAAVAAPPAVSFQHVVKEYESGKRVVDDVSIDVAQGAFVVLLGPSGCGKTTLLKTVNRLIEPTSGTILVNGE